MSLPVTKLNKNLHDKYEPKVNVLDDFDFFLKIRWKNLLGKWETIEIKLKENKTWTQWSCCRLQQKIGKRLKDLKPENSTDSFELNYVFWKD